MHQKGPISFLLDPETDRALEERAKTEGVSRSELIVEYIAEGLCFPDAVPSGGWQENPSVATPVRTGPGIRRTVYLDDRLEGTLASRASAEHISKSRLVDRLCLEGLARPPSAGTIAARAKERFVAWHRARIAHFQEKADEATKALVEEIAKFRSACPHLRLVEAKDGAIESCDCDGYAGDHAARLCEDCGTYEAEGCPQYDPDYRILSGTARLVDDGELALLATAHPYRRKS